MSFKDACLQFEYSYWQEMIQEHNRCITAVARAAQVDRGTVYKRLQAVGIMPPRRAYHRGNWGSLTH